MKLFVNIITITACLLCTTCRKKTTIKAIAYNPKLEEYVANATMVLIERKGVSGSGILSGNSSCKEIASAVTDANGVCYFDKAKLRTGRSYYYFADRKSVV